MDTFSAISLWGYQETLEELKNKLWATICELEELKNNAREEISKKEDNINQLLHLLKASNQERDEAKDQLQTILYKLTQPNSVVAEPFPSPPYKQALVSSSMSDSENFTNNNSHVSSPTVVDSPDLVLISHDEVTKVLYERFARKPLPEKGGFLKAVIEAGPILDTLFVAGSLPRWRNPPPLKPLLVPPLSIRSDDAFNTSNLLHNFSTGPQATTSTPMAYYASNAGVYNTKRPLMDNCAGSQKCSNVKRQKSQ